MKQQPRATVKKGKTGGPKSEPWRTPVKAASKVVSLCSRSNPYNEINADISSCHLKQDLLLLNTS